MLTTDDALCRQVCDWDADPSASAINDEIDTCHRCPLLDPCREMTSDMIDKGLRPRGVVQAGMHWDILGRPRGSSRADEPKDEPTKPTKPQKPDLCSHGHRFPDDCPTDTAGRRICPDCTAARAASRKAPRKNGSRHSSRSTDGHCVRGHDFDGGGRCPQCNREDARASYDRLKARALANGCTTNHQRAIEREERRHAKEAA